MSNTILIVLPTINDVKFSVEIEPEETPVKGYFTGMGTSNAEELENEIIERLESGDFWAWAEVTVKAEWRGLAGMDRLGSCSYTDENDFKKGAYYEDMKRNAYNELIAGLNALAS